MATRILLPKQGLQMAEGTIVAWLKRLGEKVSRGEPVVEIETDKTTMQIEAPLDGVLLAILCHEGDTVPVATTIAIVGEPGEDISALREERASEAAPAVVAASMAAPAADSIMTPPSAPARLYVTPRAKATASVRHVDLRDIRGTGPEGLIIERDVIQAASSSTMAKQPSREIPKASGVLVPLSSMRRTIARRMKESLAASAQASHQMDIDCTAMVRLRTDLKQAGIEISYTDIIVKAVGMALRCHPIMNSTWTDEGIFMRSEVNVGVAVALEEGLIVPVVRGADTSSLSTIHARTTDGIARAKEGALRAEDLEGAGFTVTNLGMYEVDRFIAIIDPPQTGILSVGRIAQKPVAVGGTVEIKPQMTITLSYDHRVIDGAPAARFLQTVRQLLESPCLMM
jgi:pyruvate dehydrogenase E2 component (dihydrolipoamide acetyltransferase)